MISVKRFTAALLVILFAASLIPQTQVYADSAQTTEVKVYNYLVGKLGFNVAATCGLMANIKQESGFNISETGDGNTSYGLFQWHAGRKSKLISYCKDKKLNYKTVEGQLSYFQYELKKSYKKVYDYLKSVDNSAKGAYKAGHYFCYYYEVPSNRAVKSAKRGTLARDTYWKKYSQLKGKTIEVVEKSAGNSNASTKSTVSYTRQLEVKSKNMKGADVLFIQTCLKKLGYKIGTDGKYGKGTAAIVKKFQKANGLKVDGKVGPFTWKAIAAKAASGSAAKNALKITQQPESVTIYCADTAKFTVKATGDKLTYQWYFKKAGDSSWTKWPGHDTASTSAISNTSWNDMQVKCVVKDGSGNSVTSKTAKITLVGDMVAVG